MTVETELKPCPFCGEAGKLEVVDDGVTTWIVCRKCGCDGPVARGPEQRDAAWNTRAALAGSSAKVEELKAQLKAERHRATNAEYMRHAYRQMLGPKGQQVAAAWDAAGLIRAHVSWGPGAAALDGEGIAQAHLDMTEAAKTGTPIENVDELLAALPPQDQPA